MRVNVCRSNFYKKKKKKNPLPVTVCAPPYTRIPVRVYDVIIIPRYRAAFVYKVLTACARCTPCEHSRRPRTTPPPAIGDRVLRTPRTRVVYATGGFVAARSHRRTSRTEPLEEGQETPPIPLHILISSEHRDQA